MIDAETAGSALRVLSLREHPEELERFVAFFSAHWHAEAVYRDCLTHCLNSPSPLPQWYLLRDASGATIGGAGLITNDFNARMDLWPWLCALYIEEPHRGNAYGARLLHHLRHEAGRLGFSDLYLVTEHTGYYERYGVKFLGRTADPFGDTPRVYRATCRNLEEK